MDEVWRDVGKRIGFYTKETANEIPQEPGVYAWFIPLWLYSESLNDFLHLIQTMFLFDAGEANKDQGTPTRESRLGFNWDYLDISVKKGIESKVSENMVSRWDAMKKNPEIKAGFSKVLMETTIFTPPLYVGKTDNLSARYSQHVVGTGIEKNVFHKRFTEHCRAKDLRLRVSDLLFVCVKTTSETNRIFREQRLNELLESILVRLAKPPFSCR